jgi:hypothetical protein
VKERQGRALEKKNKAETTGKEKKVVVVRESYLVLHINTVRFLEF